MATLEKINFPLSTSSDWAKMATQELNQADPFVKLSLETNGLSVKPYYDAKDVSQTSEENSISAFTSWCNAPRVLVTDSKSANRLALQHLNSGADGVLFDLKASVLAADLLEGIELPYCHVFFLCDHRSDVPFIESFKTFLSKKKWKKTSGSIYWNNDSISNVLPPANFQVGFQVRQQDNGIDQLTDALRLAVNQIDFYTQSGLSAESSLKSFSWLWPVKPNFFISVAELRALRMLWPLLAEAYGVKNASPFIHSFSPSWIKEAFQPHGNLIAQTTSGLAAVLGNCNALTCEAEKEGISMLTRTARNISSILKEESHLGKTMDPLAGSYLIENMSQELAAKAWKKFQETV